MTNSHLVSLIPLFPLVGATLLGLIALLWSHDERGFSKPVVAAIACLGPILSCLVATRLFFGLADHPQGYVHTAFTWFSVGALHVPVEFWLDRLSGVMAMVVTFVGSLIHIYSVGYMSHERGFTRFFAYLNLFLASMLVLVLGSNLLTLFLGWELVGLSSYLLIGFWFEKRAYASAAKKAFITNRVGDVSFMVAMFLAFATVGTLDLLALNEAAPGLSAGVATALVLLLLGGAAAKSAQIPLYVWLPDAMAGPTPVSALIHAATMVTAGVYLTVRTSPVLTASVDAMEVIAWIGVLTALLAAVIALRQDDIKKVLAYSTVSQLGYMFLAVGVGAFREGIFHLVTHAFFKGLLFLAAGSVMHALHDETDLWRMGGLRRAMPVTFATSAVAWLAISGVPPFAGFFSKDQILTEAYKHGYGAIYLLGLAGAILTAFYMTRWFVLVFLGPARHRDGVHPHESPASMAAPLVVLGVLSAAGGLLNPVHEGPLYRFLGPVVAPIGDLGYAPVGPLEEPALIGISIVAVAFGLGLAWWLYARRDLTPGRVVEPVRGTFADLAERRFLVDEAYAAVFVGGGGAVARGLARFDGRVVDGLVRGAGATAVLAGRVARRAQGGRVRGYVAVTVVGLAALLLLALWTVR